MLQLNNCNDPSNPICNDQFLPKFVENARRNVTKLKIRRDLLLRGGQCYSHCTALYSYVDTVNELFDPGFILFTFAKA